MSRRFIELVVRARRLVTRAPERVWSERERARPSAHRQLGGELTQFSFRLALMVDLAYVGIGALGGAAIGRASAPAVEGTDRASAPACPADSTRDSVPST